MPRYRVFYLKEELSRRFRELPAGSVKKQIKARDYNPAGEIEAATEYAAWKALQDPAALEPQAPRVLAVGDALETEDGKLRLCMFGGFEDAAWWVPEPAPAEASAAPEVSLLTESPAPEVGAAATSDPPAGASLRAETEKS